MHITESSLLTPPESVQIVTGDCRKWIKNLEDATIDLVVTSPPYFIGKEYDRSNKAADFLPEISALLPDIKRILKPGGSVCWQVGYHVTENRVVPLDYYIHSIFEREKEFTLRNRIIWTFGHGVHCQNRFSGRHETIMWYTKGEQYHFDLDVVRVPQKYPGKRHYKGPNHGEWSGNPNGKNPADVWEIPNVKAGHVEKTAHPCQFPVALVGRLIAAMCPEGGAVADPFLGSGSSAVAATLLSRRFFGCDRSATYIKIARERLAAVRRGEARIRPDEPVFEPLGHEAVSQRPPHFSAGSNLIMLLQAPEDEEAHAGAV